MYVCMPDTREKEQSFYPSRSGFIANPSKINKNLAANQPLARSLTKFYCCCCLTETLELSANSYINQKSKTCKAKKEARIISTVHSVYISLFTQLKDTLKRTYLRTIRTTDLIAFCLVLLFLIRTYEYVRTST